MSKTAIVWADGERFVFRGEEVDRMLEIGADADSAVDAWDKLVEYGREIDA